MVPFSKPPNIKILNLYFCSKVIHENPGDQKSLTKSPFKTKILSMDQTCVMTADFHLVHAALSPNLLTCCQDGNVAVYNLQKESRAPVYLSTPVNGKHLDTVWQVGS
jgi:hypothetical protein